MKKVPLFLFAIAVTLTVSAQSGKRQDRDRYPSHDDKSVVWKNKSRSWENNGRNNSYERKVAERDREIRMINYNYDRRIEHIRKSRFMRAAEKKRQIRLLERQRTEAIRSVNVSFRNEVNRSYGRSNGRRY